MVGRTTMLIAHRRSTLRLADRIVLVDGGRVADSGTHDELLARTPALPRAARRPRPPRRRRRMRRRSATAPALAGGAGGQRERPRQRRRPDRAAWRHGAEAWPAAAGRAPPAPRRQSRRATAMGRRRGARGGAGGHARAGRPRCAASRRPTTTPTSTSTREAAPRTSRSASGSSCARTGTGLVVGFALVALDALLTLVGPLAVRRASTTACAPATMRMLWLAGRRLPRRGLADWGVTRAYTLVTGRTAERLLYALRVRVFAHLQRLSLDYYDREMGGRVMTRMTTDVEALQHLLQTGLVTAIVSIFTCVGVLVFLVVLSPPLALAAARRAAAAGRRHLVVPPALGRRLRRGPRPHRHGQRQLPGEPLGRAGRPGLRPRGPQHRRLPRRQRRLPRTPGSAPSADRPLLPVRAAALRAGRPPSVLGVGSVLVERRRRSRPAS